MIGQRRDLGALLLGGGAGDFGHGGRRGLGFCGAGRGGGSRCRRGGCGGGRGRFFLLLGLFLGALQGLQLFALRADFLGLSIQGPLLILNEALLFVDAFDQAFKHLFLRFGKGGRGRRGKEEGGKSQETRGQGAHDVQPFWAK